MVLTISLLHLLFTRQMICRETHRLSVAFERDKMHRDDDAPTSFCAQHILIHYDYAASVAFIRQHVS